MSYKKIISLFLLISFTFEPVKSIEFDTAVRIVQISAFVVCGYGIIHNICKAFSLINKIKMLDKIENGKNQLNGIRIPQPPQQINQPPLPQNHKGASYNQIQRNFTNRDWVDIDLRNLPAFSSDE